MKKTITKMFVVTGIVAATALSLNAQVSNGSLMFGGSLGANITMESTSKKTGGSDVKTPGYTEWNFSPTVGYFVSDGLAIGLNLNLNSMYKYFVTSADGKIRENIMESGTGFGLFARKYMVIAGSLYMHTQAGVSYTATSYTDKDNDGLTALKDGDKVSATNLGINLTPGLTFFASPKWGIDFSLNNIVGYNMTSSKREVPASGTIAAYTVETSGGSFSIGAGLMPSLGLFYYMGK